MDAHKFEYLLKTSALYFPRADSLLGFDAKEGALTNRMLEFVDDNFTLKFVGDLKRNNAQSLGGIQIVGRGRLEVRNQIRAYVRMHYAFMLKRTYVNCWHVNADENYLMWESYVRQKPGVAIRSTVGQLESALSHDTSEVFAASIDYVDHDTAPLDFNRLTGGMSQIVMDMITKKRKPFKNESELRLVVDTLTEDEKWAKGLYLVPKGQHIHKDNPTLFLEIPVDLGQLINQVVLQPDSDWEFQKKIRAIILENTPSGSSYDFSKIVAKSKI